MVMHRGLVINMNHILNTKFPPVLQKAGSKMQCLCLFLFNQGPVKMFCMLILLMHMWNACSDHYPFFFFPVYSLCGEPYVEIYVYTCTYSTLLTVCCIMWFLLRSVCVKFGALLHAIQPGCLIIMCHLKHSVPSCSFLLYSKTIPIQTYVGVTPPQFSDPSSEVWPSLPLSSTPLVQVPTLLITVFAKGLQH